MGNCGKMEDLCIIGENIKMRDINSTLQKQLGSLKERASPVGGQRDTLSSNSIEDNVSKDLQAVDLVNFTEATEVDSELGSLSRRKRKQENINIHKVSSKISHSKQSVLTQDKVGEAQEGLLEAVEVELGILKVCDAAMGSLQVCDSSQDLKRCKMKIEASLTHEVGFDMSTVAARAPNDKLGLVFDTKVHSTTALGFKHASCSIAQWKDREGTDAVNNIREKGFTSTSDEALETTITASAVSTKDANVKKVSLMDQTENQRLRAALAALQSQFNVLSSLAEKGSRNCGYCQSVKEEIRKLSFNCGDISAGQVSAGKVATRAQSSAYDEPQECSSPVGSCTSEKTAMSNEDCKRLSSSVLHTRQTESTRKDTMPHKDKDSDLPMRNYLHEDIEEAECHLCIELASSQSEDLDAEQMKVQGGSLESERNASIKCPLATERESRSEKLHTSSEENKSFAPDVTMHGHVSSEFGKGADNFNAAVEDEGECEGLSDKNSKEEGCWNSGLTRNSWESPGGDGTNEAEDDGYIDLKCGCTSQKYGDTAGILRLFQSGKVEIQCQCSLGCIKGKPMSPANFERHSGRGASKKWKETIWIVLGDRKVQFSKVKGLDAFVRRYKDSSRGRLRQPGPAKLPYHRDEFMKCKKCSKRRRFRRKTKEDCRLFHEASMNSEWECSNYPFDSVFSCQDDEEREARQANRGCIRSRTCQGCIECVCLGCFTCRFEDCSCRLCIEYIVNNK